MFIVDLSILTNNFIILKHCYFQISELKEIYILLGTTIITCAKFHIYSLNIT